MTKKNNMSDYTQATQDNQTLLKWAIKNGFALASVVVVILNLWLTTKLQAVVERIKVLEVRAENIEEYSKENRESIKSQFSVIDARLIRIENKIDTHMGK